MNCNGFGSKQSWPNRVFSLGTRLEGLILDSRYPSRDSKRALSEYKTTALAVGLLSRFICIKLRLKSFYYMLSGKFHYRYMGPMYQSLKLPACIKFKYNKFPKTLIEQNMAILLVHRGRVKEMSKNENVYSSFKRFLNDITLSFWYSFIADIRISYSKTAITVYSSYCSLPTWNGLLLYHLI